ncbi:MAG: family 16 glycoside hydrolase, partial [Aurantibacter sp.]
MIKKVCIGLSLIVGLNIAFGQKREKRNNKEIRLPMEAKYWSPISDNVEFTTYKNVPAVKSNDGNGFGVMLKDLEFADGTIEFDVELKGSGFPGIDFRMDKDTLNAEKFYIRYFGTPNALSRTTLQYAAILDRVNLWDLTDDYQAAATIHEGKWNHVKLVVSGRQLRVYVNDMQRAALHVPAMEGITNSGAIALTGNVVYANFVIRPNATEDLASNEGYDPTYGDSRYLRNWLVTDPKDFPIGTDIMRGISEGLGIAIDTVLFDSTAVWRPLKAGRRALVNLTKIFGATELGQRKLTWIKTTIYSETTQKKRVDLGFSDEVWV